MRITDRPFRVFVTATAVSACGNYLNLIALSLFSYAVTGTAFGVGALMAVRLGSGFLAGFIAGEISARVSRRTVMICADTAQGVAMGVLALSAPHTPMWLLACAVMVLGAGNTFFSVALRGAVPVMVGHEARVHANGLLVTARSSATVLGFTVAAPVIALGGYTLAFTVNGLSFAVSAVTLLVLRPRTDGDGTLTEAEGHRDTTSTSPSTSGRWRWRPTTTLPALLLGMILLRGVDALASASHNVALPVVAHTTAPSDPAVFMTRFWAAWAVGTILAHQVLKRRQGATAWGERAFAVGTCAMSLSFVAAFAGPPPWALIAVAVSAGFSDGWTEIIYTSRLQAAPDRQRGRSFGLTATAEQLGFALGTIVAAAALEVSPALAVVGAFHGVAVSGALVLLLFTAGRRRDGRQKPSPGGRAGGGKVTYGTGTKQSSLPGA